MGIILITIIDVVKLTLTVGGTTPWAGILDCIQWRMLSEHWLAAKPGLHMPYGHLLLFAASWALP